MAEPAPYVFKPHERPTLPGSPANPEHPQSRRMGYLAIGSLLGLTGALGTALITVNLSIVQGSLSLDSRESAWLTAAYLMTNVTANLLLMKYRQQFGLQPFVRYILASYALATIAHLLAHQFWSAVLVRAVSGVAGAGLSTLTILYMMQGMTPAKRLGGVMLGISIPQLATPLARVLSPTLLESGDWHMAYYFEFGLAAAALAAVWSLPLPPSEREQVFERSDFLTFGLLGPGLWLLVAVLSEGRIQWWTEQAWIGWALAASVALIAAALIVEHNRENPLINTRWLGTREMVRLMMIAASVRILLSEQTFGSVGLLTLFGLLNDQMRTLNLIIILASLAGLFAMLVTFNPRKITQPFMISVALIAVGAFMDADATNVSRPENFYVSQALIAFASIYFLGPAMVIGISRTLLAGPKHFISFAVLFNMSQNLGGLIGTALLGTFQIVREKFHSHAIVQWIVATDPQVAARIRAGSGAVSGVVGDPALRSAEGAALLAQQATREANILAYNDVFLLVGILACLALIWGISITYRIYRRQEKSPIILLQERMQQARGNG